MHLRPDWIVAMGGGSPIDAAKAMWAFYEYPDVTFRGSVHSVQFPGTADRKQNLLQFHLHQEQRQK